MKNRLFSAMFVASALMAAPAWAAPVFMLQFGSFESREEAEKRLSELKTQHAGVLKAMPAGVTEVSLPPDNLTVYRTQAGPLNTRNDAQSVCAQLASNGDECYVVETAMAPSFAPATTQVASVAPAPAATMAVAPAASVSTTQAPAAATGTSPLAPNAAPPVAMAPVNARDPMNTAAINGVSTPVASSMPTASSATNVSPEMQSAMDKAAQQQADAQKRMAAELPPVDKKTADTAAAMSAAPAPEKLTVAPVTMDTTRVVTSAEPLPLPPPPAPLMARTATAPAAAPAATVAPTAGTVQSAPLPAPAANGTPFKSGPSVVANSKANEVRPVTTPAVIVPATGNVTVAEAQRVPLTELNNVPIAPVTGSVASPIAPSEPVISLKPSSTIGVKTLWSQVGYFKDAQTALAFWDNYRRTHPDFPVVRVRVTQPYQIATRGLGNVSLRVGPFGREASIRNLCASIDDIEDKEEKGIKGIRCGMVTDMGIASSARGTAGFLPDSRYKRSQSSMGRLPFGYAEPRN